MCEGPTDIMNTTNNILGGFQYNIALFNMNVFVYAGNVCELAVSKYLHKKLCKNLTLCKQYFTGF